MSDARHTAPVRSSDACGGHAAVAMIALLRSFVILNGSYATQNSRLDRDHMII